MRSASDLEKEGRRGHQQIKLTQWTTASLSTILFLSLLTLRLPYLSAVCVCVCAVQLLFASLLFCRIGFSSKSDQSSERERNKGEKEKTKTNKGEEHSSRRSNSGSYDERTRTRRYLPSLIAFLRPAPYTHTSRKPKHGSDIHPEVDTRMGELHADCGLNTHTF